MEVFTLLDNLEDLIENSKKVPLSNKSMVEQKEVLNLIKDIYSCSYITGKFKTRFTAIQNTRVLRPFCKMLTIKMLQNFMQNVR